MNTEQNYGEGAPHATDSEQSAKNNPATTDGQQPLSKVSPFFAPPLGETEAAIQRHYRDLHEIIDEQRHSSGFGSPIALLQKLWVGWSLQHTGDISPGESVTIKGDVLDDTYVVMELMTFLAKIGEEWSSIEHLEERYTYAQP